MPATATVERVVTINFRASRNGWKARCNPSALRRAFNLGLREAVLEFLAPREPNAPTTPR